MLIFPSNCSMSLFIPNTSLFPKRFFKPLKSYKTPFSLLWGITKPILWAMPKSSALCLREGASACFSANAISFKNQKYEEKLCMKFWPFYPFCGSDGVSLPFSVNLGQNHTNFWDKLVLYIKLGAGRKVSLLDTLPREPVNPLCAQARHETTPFFAFVGF